MARKRKTMIEIIDGQYEFDSDDLGWCLVHGSYRDQGCMTATFKGKTNRIQNNHLGGDFKISPNVIAKFLREVGVTLHFETEKKHSYVSKIELKPWSDFENSLRKPIKSKG